MRMTNKPYTYCLECREVKCYAPDCAFPACEDRCIERLNHMELVEEIICSPCMAKIMIADLQKKKKGNGKP